MIAGQSETPDGYSLDITVARAPCGVSRLARRRVRHPWSLGRAFPGANAQDALTIIPQAAGGGLLAGDVQNQRVRVEPGARVRLVAAGATVVYGSPGRGPVAAQSWRFELGRDAALATDAEPFVLRERSAFLTSQTVVLPESGVFLGCEAIVIDAAADASWRSRLVVERPDGTQLLVDAQQSNDGLTRRLAGGSRPWRAFATLYLIAPRGRRDALALAAAETGCALDGGVIAAAAPLRGGLGVGVRLVATDGGALRNAARALHGRIATALDLGPTDEGR